MERAIFAAVMACAGIGMGFAQQFIPPQSNRMVINLGDTPWKFIKQDVAGAQNPAHNDTSWDNVGIPHCYSQFDTYVNSPGGTTATHNTVWYRKRFQLGSTLQDRSVYLVFERVNVGCAVYVNGKFIPGNTLVQQPAGSQVTHVGGFIPFAVDITTYVVFGATENTIAVRVENAQRWDTTWFTTPPGAFWGMGSAHGGILAPVWLILTDKVHIPPNVYSVVNRWGTHYTTTFATDAVATILCRVHAYNCSLSTQHVSATTVLVDTKGVVVAELPHGERTIGIGQSVVLSGTLTVTQPRLWYPNNSPHGIPYLYTVYSMLYRDGILIDIVSERIGIRTIQWNNDYAIINGHVHTLWGGSMRYDYPGLGQAVPRDQRWRDMKLLADCGGNFFRPAHCAAENATVEACDYYGILITQPCQDDEGATQTTAHVEYKKEFMRDIIVYQRNRPSILAWEIKNGGAPTGFAATMKNIIQLWDAPFPRAMADTNYPTLVDWNLADIVGMMNYAGGDKRSHPTKPVYSCEAWLMCTGRHAWREEHAETYVNWFVRDTKDKCAGGLQFMFIDMPGEDWQTIEGPRGRGDGRGALDMNRIPKMLYHVWGRAVWIPFDRKPGVFIAHHWNRSVPAGSTVAAKVWSNCPSVELFLNDVSHGVRIPNSWDVYPEYQCTWVLPYASGTIRAVGKDEAGTIVCVDEQRTAGPPSRIQLTIVEPIHYPDGSWSQITANGSDCAFITASVVDEAGVVCPTSSHTLTFSVNGPARYVGGTNFYYTPGQPVNFNAPGNANLAVEAGIVRIAVQSTFVSGIVTVNASCQGLMMGTTQFITVAPGSGAQTATRLSVHASHAHLFADGVSSATVHALVVDNQGTRVMTSSASILFSISGPGALIGPNPTNAVEGMASIGICAGTSSGTIIVSANSLGLIPSSTAIIVRVQNAAPSAPVHLRCEGMVNPSSVSNFNPVLSWEHVDRDGDLQTHWRILVSSDIDQLARHRGEMWDSGMSVGSSSQTAYAGVPLSPGVTYYWKVMTWDVWGGSSPFSEVAMFSMAANRPPSAPSDLRTNGIINPSSVTTPRPMLSWSYTDPDGDSQSGWQICMSNNMVEMANVWDSGQVLSSATSVTYYGPVLSPGFYYWRVRVWDARGSTSPYSSVGMFIVIATSTMNQTPVVNLTSPVNGSTYTTPASITISATASDSDGSITVVRFYAGTTLLGVDSTSPYAYTWTNVGAGSYFLSAQAEDNQGAVGESGPVNITVNPAVQPAQPVLVPGEVRVVGGADGYINATTSPNAMIRFRRETAGVVAIKIYDLRGRLVFERSKDGPADTDDEVVWNTTDLAAGVYLVRINGRGIQRTVRIVVAR